MAPPSHFPSLRIRASSIRLEEQSYWDFLPRGRADPVQELPKARLVMLDSLWNQANRTSPPPPWGLPGPVPSPRRLQYQSIQLKGDDGCHSTLPTVTPKNKQKRILLSLIPRTIHSFRPSLILPISTQLQSTYYGPGFTAGPGI